MKLRFSLVAIVVVAILLIYALYRKGDLKAAFNTPVIEFSIETKEQVRK